jgi:O-antigen ligase
VQAAGGAKGQGAAMIAVLAVLTAAAALAAGRDLRDGRVAVARRVAVAALAVLVVGTVLAVARGGHQPLSSGTQRLVSVQSNRSAYWKVALAVFAAHPLHGVGSGSFQVEWLERRPFAESVRDAHSLYLETFAELGLVGAACLAVFLFGCGLAARRGPPAAVAALGAFALHAGIDWDWEMPALSLIAILLVARLAAAQER